MKTTLPVLLILFATLGACAQREPAARAEINYFDPPPAIELQQPEPEPDRKPIPTYRTDIVITTGVHGNEPSGYLVQGELIELGFNCFGPCNPWGIENNSRYLENGLDLNRVFGKEDITEVEAVKSFLADNKPGFLLDLHEDPDGTAPYLIQHGPEDNIGRMIIDALADEIEWHPTPKFSIVQGEDGLIKPTRSHLNFMKLGGVYGLGFHAWYTYGCTAIVVECPGSWTEKRRKAYQLKVCKKAREIYTDIENSK